MIVLAAGLALAAILVWLGRGGIIPRSGLRLASVFFGDRCFGRRRGRAPRRLAQSLLLIGLSAYLARRRPGNGQGHDAPTVKMP